MGVKNMKEKVTATFYLKKWLLPFQSRKSMTLIEVLVGFVVVALVSVAGWVSVNVLTKSAVASRYHNQAADLIQKSQEELKKNSLAYFHLLETCQFPPTTENTCGFEDIAAAFPGFTRTLGVTRHESSTELKRALVTVSWSEWGRPKKLESVVLLARPPAALPGNIKGQVTDRTTGGLIESAQVTVTFEEGSAPSKSTLSSRDLFDGVNYNFQDPVSGLFMLDVGSWILTAHHEDYYDYAHPESVFIAPNEEKIINFQMTPKPRGAKLTVRLFDKLTGSPAGFSSSSRIQIYNDGGSIKSQSGGSEMFYEFSSDELTDEGINLTVATQDAYLSAYAGDFACVGGTSAYYHGWSSAIDRRDIAEGIDCARPRQGSFASDRIFMEREVDKTQDVYLTPVAMAALQGYVKDSAGNAIASARIYVRWHNNNVWYPYPAGYTNSTGFYSVQVPAGQELFTNNLNNYLRVTAYGRVDNIKHCCNVEKNIWRYNDGGWLRVGPLFQGSVIMQDFVISRADADNCGNVRGNITDDYFNQKIPDVSVKIVSVTEKTGAAGGYIYECPPDTADYFRLNTGSHTFYADHGLYYNYSSAGNTWYASGPNVNVSLEDWTTYDARLWPRGKGYIAGDVYRAGTDKTQTVSNARIKLTLYTGETVTVYSDDSGHFKFPGSVLETWPPPELAVKDPARIYYNHTQRIHWIDADHESGFYDPVKVSVPFLENDQTLDLDIELPLKGGGM